MFCFSHLNTLLLIYYTESFIEEVDSVLELSDAGNLAEVKKVLTLGLVPRPTSD
jgi:hypothetical protein